MAVITQQSLMYPPPKVVTACGSFLTLEDGRVIIDGDGGAAVSCIGHSDPRVLDAMRNQGATVDYLWSGNFATDVAERLAELLLAEEPGGLTHAYFTGSGSEAIEAALKLARQHFVEAGEPDREHFIGRRQSFHGVTAGALSLSGHPARRAKFAPLLLPRFSHVSPCFPFREQREDEDDGTYVSRLAAELDSEIERLGPHKVAAFVAETIIGGTCGAVVPTKGYLTAIKRVCRRHGVLLILDEVMCGMGRAGLSYAWQDEDATPDIVAIGKSLAGGYQPLSAVLATRKVIDPIWRGGGRFIHGQTFQAHPIACAAAIAVQEIIVEEDLMENVRNRGARLREALRAELNDNEIVGDVRGKGFMIGIELVRERGRASPFPSSAKIAERLKAAALEKGLSLFAGSGTIDGYTGDHVLLAPSFRMDGATQDAIVERLIAAVAEVTREIS